MPDALAPSADVVPLGTGLPTRAELLVHYPAKFTWIQLKTFVNSGDLGLLKRDRRLQQRYDLWIRGVKEKHGSMVNYLLNYRLQWGKPDTLSLLGSAVHDEGMSTPPILEGLSSNADLTVPRKLPPLPEDAPAYFSESTPPQYLSIIQNDWPYSVPSDVEHTLVWTRIPIFHPDIVAESVRARVEQDGLWGFTGNTSPPPSPSTLPSCVPALAEWGFTIDKMIKSEKGTVEEELLVAAAGRPVDNFVKQRWVEDEWETAWFVNPPRLQSVPGLAHVHVFARHK
ncbi:hypothetical protein FB45DRAFT_735602 [Roridomyces roridus]|uniref:Uncharacterized protein n=1 Tax=Roridomyces roridus TaxID=1738132 RepID=A0AAD7FUG9_9AGAR|nr:hypothetical protein FB45DRAFT_735602 [Roridomyces roridus]